MIGFKTQRSEIVIYIVSMHIVHRPYSVTVVGMTVSHVLNRCEDEEDEEENISTGGPTQNTTAWRLNSIVLP